MLPHEATSVSVRNKVADSIPVVCKLPLKSYFNQHISCCLVIQHETWNPPWFGCRGGLSLIHFGSLGYAKKAAEQPGEEVLVPDVKPKDALLALPVAAHKVQEGRESSKEKRKHKDKAQEEGQRQEERQA